MRNLINNENFWFPKKLYKMQKNPVKKIVFSKKIYKFFAVIYFIGVIFVLLFIKKRFYNPRTIH